MVSRYEEGKFARMEGKVKNPHEPGTWDRKEWQRGWDDQSNWLAKYWNYRRNTSLFS